MTKAELLDRLRAADGPDRELDADIAAYLGVHFDRRWKYRFTGFLDAALGLVADVLGDWMLGLSGPYPNGDYVASVDDDCKICASHKSPSIALLIALLTAIGEV